MLSTNANRMTTLPRYDLAGNLTGNAGAIQSTYDAEGRLCATPRSNGGYEGYLYDAAGNRVAKGIINAVIVMVNQQRTLSCDTTVNGFVATSQYLLGAAGEQMTELDGTGAWVHTNVTANGMLIATFDNDNMGAHFTLTDWLGTKRVQTNYLGAVEQTCQSLPFGDGLNCPGSVPDATEHHFTGKERDAESGLDYFGARYYASGMGRFMSPDWSAKAEPVPYAKMDNPQTLNLYQYMRNNPLSGADPDGHCDWCQKLWNGITGNGFQTNAQIAQTAALNAPETITETHVDKLPANLTLGPGMAEAIEGEKSNSLVDLGTSVVGLISATPGVVPGTPGLALGLGAAGASTVNDPSALNKTINGTGAVLGVASAVGEGTAVGTAATFGGLGVAAGATAWSASNFISNIVTSVFAPPPEAMNINGTTVQQPELSDIPPR